MGFPNSRMIIINSQIFPSVGCLGRKIRLEDHYAASRRQLMDTEAKLREVQGQCYLGLVKNVENISLVKLRSRKHGIYRRNMMGTMGTQ